MISERRIVNVASYNRIESLMKTVDSIYDQCDELNIFLNDFYGEIPSRFFDKKINVYFSDNRFGDSLKFAKLKDSDGYYLTIDDDLIYPKNYVDHMIARCKEYSNQRVVTLHGKKFSSFPIQSFYKSHSEFYHCLQSTIKNVLVQFGGTGVMCFHTSLFKIPIDYFKFPNMADIWIGKYCMENKIEIICLKHSKDYLQYIPQKTTIYDVESKNDFIQTQVVNSIFDKTISLENLKNYSKNNPLVQTPNIPIPQPTRPPHEPVKITKTLEKTQKQINYDKINSIFQISGPKVISQQQPKQETSHLKLNSQTFSKIQRPKKRFK